MNLSSWSDSDLLSTREKLLAWYVQSQHGNRWRFGALMVLGLLGIGALLVGIGTILEHGLDAENGILTVIGVVTAFLMRRQDKQFKANIDFIAELNSELSKRGHKL